MGVYRENGYSAHVEAFLVIGGEKIRLAKTNGRTLTLADHCEIAPNTQAELLISIDDYRESKQVLIEEGTTQSRQPIRYSVVAPF